MAADLSSSWPAPMIDELRILGIRAVYEFCNMPFLAFHDWCSGPEASCCSFVGWSAQSVSGLYRVPFRRAIGVL